MFTKNLIISLLLGFVSAKSVPNSKSLRTPYNDAKDGEIIYTQKVRKTSRRNLYFQFEN